MVFSLSSRRIRTSPNTSLATLRCRNKRRALSQLSRKRNETRMSQLSNRAATSATSAKQQASVSTPSHSAASNNKPRNQLALLSLSGALLAAGPAGAAAAHPGPADVAPTPISSTAVQHISSNAALKFPSVSAPKVYASDAGLTTRTASGPALNYDDLDAYWDQLEGGNASRTTTPPSEFLPVKYVEAAAGPSVVADLADLNADVRGLSENYRDPAGAIQQDKAADAASSSSTPDLSSATESAKSAASDIKSKAKSTLKGNSALPNDMGTVADGPAFRGLKESFKPESEKDPNAGAFGDYSARNPDAERKAKEARKDLKSLGKSVLTVKGGNSALPTNPLAVVADQNADVRGLSENYRDPAGAIQQDKAADALSSSSTPDLSSATESAKGAASDLKSKAKSALKGNSALPNSMGTVADLNADVRGHALNYRDPAIAVPQDKVTGTSGSSGAAAESMSGDQGADVRGAAGTYRDPAGAIQQDNFVDAVKDKVSALPNPLAVVADQNADVRGLSEDYRDPAGAIQQDKAADALSSSSTPDLSSATESAKGAASDLKSKAKSALKGNSALPNSLGTVADLNKDVRGEAADYRDPAGAIQQDKAAEALFSSSTPDLSSAAKSAKGAAFDLKSKAKSALKDTSGAADKVVSGATSATKGLPTKGLSTPSVPKSVKKTSADVREVADKARGSVTTPGGNARLSRPLVRDSLGQLRPQAVNQTGAAGGGQKKGVKMAKKAAAKVGEFVDDVASN